MGDQAIQYQGLHHLALVCRDMQRTVDFYTTVMGMRLKKGFDLPGGYGQHFFFDMGNGEDLAFFWFRDAPPSAPGIASAGNLTGRRGATITSAHGSMNHVAFNIAPDAIEAYRELLMSRGVDCTPIVNHADTVAPDDPPITREPGPQTWVRSFYFFDPDQIMLEFCATTNVAREEADSPVDATGRKRDGTALAG